MGNPITSLGNTLEDPPAELTLREKVELGIEKSGVNFETAYDADRIADSIIEVLQPPKPAEVPAEVPAVEPPEGDPV